jgi:anti-anti-sigma factor
MHFTIDQRDGVTVFKLNEPRLDSQNAGQLKAEFLILAQPDVEKLIVDLSQVSHVDSAGLSALLLAERQQSAHGGDVRLVGVSDNVKSLLRITQLDRIFPMYATVNEAIQADMNMEASEPRTTLGPGAPTKDAIRTGAIAAGGSLGAAALAGLIMNPSMLAGDDEDYDDDDDEDEYDDLDEVDEADVDEDDDDDEEGDEDLDELGDDYDDEDAYSDEDDLEGDLAEEDDEDDDEDDEEDEDY